MRLVLPTTFSNVVLAAGGTVAVHTGTGDNYDGHLYLDRKSQYETMTTAQLTFTMSKVSS